MHHRKKFYQNKIWKDEARTRNDEEERVWRDYVCTRRAIHRRILNFGRCCPTIPCPVPPLREIIKKAASIEAMVVLMIMMRITTTTTSISRRAMVMMMMVRRGGGLGEMVSVRISGGRQ